MGVTKRTVRYYEEQGLLNPTTRSEKGYRLYTKDDITRLERILELRDIMGFSLKDIGRVLKSEETIAELQQAYHSGETNEEKKENVRHIICNYKQFIQLIGQKRAQLEKIESIYSEKLKRIEKFLGELE